MRSWPGSRAIAGTSSQRAICRRATVTRRRRVGFGADWLLMARAEHLRMLGAPTRRPASPRRVGRRRRTCGTCRLPWQGILLVHLHWPWAPRRRPVGDRGTRGGRPPDADREQSGAAMWSHGLIERDPSLSSTQSSATDGHRCNPSSRGAARTQQSCSTHGRRDDAVALLNERRRSTPRSRRRATAPASTPRCAGSVCARHGLVPPVHRSGGIRSRRWSRRRRARRRGLTNPRSVPACSSPAHRGVHLAHVFRKLDVRNRTQLVAALATRPP